MNMCECVCVCVYTGHVILPVNTLHHDENFLPGSVGSGLPVYDGISEKFLQALHVYNM